MEKARACQRRYYERNRELYYNKNKRKKEKRNLAPTVAVCFRIM